jgi:hypothetical protein
MQKMNTRERWAAISAGIIIIVGIAVAIIHHHSPSDISENNTQQDNTPTSTAAVGVVLSSTGENSVAATTAPSKSSSTSSSSATTLPGPTITIDLLTPIANNTWTIGQPNPIAWSAAAGISGEIDLVDATTKQFIGVIISNIGPDQTSYIWDARAIYLGRYSADKKDVVPGTYSIRIHFDGNGLSDLVSGPITISN